MFRPCERVVSNTFTFPFFCGQLIHCFGLLVTSAMGFRAIVDPFFACSMWYWYLRFTTCVNLVIVTSMATESFWSTYLYTYILASVGLKPELCLVDINTLTYLKTLRFPVFEKFVKSDTKPKVSPLGLRVMVVMQPRIRFHLRPISTITLLTASWERQTVTAVTRSDVSHLILTESHIHFHYETSWVSEHVTFQNNRKRLRGIEHFW